MSTTHLVSDLLTIAGLWAMELRRRYYAECPASLTPFDSREEVFQFCGACSIRIVKHPRLALRA